ncbi:MAG: hypothetical protein ACI4O0_09095 [Candidatus Limivicinus sp.]
MTYSQAMNMYVYVLAALTAIACGSAFLRFHLRKLRHQEKNYICCQAQLARVEKLGRCGMCGVYLYVDGQGQQREYRDLHGTVLDGEGGASLYARPEVTLYVARDSGRVVLRR